MQERESVQRREQWFLQGRETSPGQSSATMRRKAVQQKLWMRSVRAQKLAMAVKLQANSISGSGSWKSLGPAPLSSDGNAYGQVTGRVTSVAIDPADPTGNTVFVSGAQGGVWKSSNAAATNAASVNWTPLTDEQSTLATGTIAIQPGNSNPATSLVLVGTGEGNSSADSYFGMGILRSTDGGSTWGLISNAGARSLDGLGTTHIAFSTASPNTVVAAMKSTGVGFETGSLNTNPAEGLYTSSDAGRTWTYNQLVEPGGQQTIFTPATSVVYNAAQGQFFAAIRDHGFYSSPDGVNWTRLTTQPGTSSQLNSTNCPAQPTQDVNGVETCPIYRGEIAVVPGRNEMYVWYVALTYINSTTVGFVDEGIWKSVNGGQSWTAISTTAIDNCGDPKNAGCGVYQGWYDLTLAAVPSGASGTDLYAGAVNLFKCAINSSNPSCSTQPFLNLTHVYGCDTSQVHPDEHATAFIITGSGTDLMYFGNDGGVYRALDGFTGLTNGSCTAANKFDDLNQNLGPLTQFVDMSQDPTNAAVLIGGTQDNGTEATGSATTNTTWTTVQGGDGGFNAIDPNSTSSWFASFPDPGNGNLNIRHCPNGINCTDAMFSPVVTSTSIGGDDGPFYPSYTLDPQSDTSMLVGTCRVWRGPRLGGSYTAISGKFDDANSSACTGAELNTVRSIAAGGPIDSNGSQVVYATTNGTGPYAYTVNPNLEWTGRVWATTNASGGPANFQDVTANINQNHEPISSVVIDPSDATGQTAYVGIMGFSANGLGEHVFKTTNASAWLDWSGSGAFALPDSPVNALVIDSSTQTVYAATDVGVFESSTITPIWTEVGPAAGSAGFLPNVAVTGLTLFNSGGQKLLRASTYGRGIWQFDVLKNPPTPVFDLTLPLNFPEYFAGQNFSISGTLAALNGYNNIVNLSCTSAEPTACQSFPAAIPASCSGNPSSVVPLPQGTPGVLQTKGTAGFYCFNMHAAGTDPSGIAQDQIVFLNFFDLTITPMSPASVTIPRGTTSQPINFNLVLNGWNSQPDPVFRCGLPPALAGSACNVTLQSSYNGTNAASLMITVPATTQPGTYSVTIHAYVTLVGANAPSQQTLTVVVTKNTTFLLSEPTAFPNVKAGSAGATAPFAVTSLDGFSGTVHLSCAPDNPADSCSVSPSDVSVGSNPTSTNVTISANNIEQSRAVLTGTSGAITQSIPISFNVGSYGIAQPNSFPTVFAGGTTTTSVSLSGIFWYDGSVQATCDVAAIAGAQCTLLPVSPYVLTPNSGGDSTATFSVTVGISKNAAPGAYNVAINTADIVGQPTANVTVPLTIQQDYQIGTITPASGTGGSVTPGGTASYNFNVAPVGASYSGNITLGCSISPATTTMSCVLSPASVSPGNQATPVAMTVNTQAKSVAQSNSFIPIAGLGLLLPILGLFGAWRGSRRRRFAAGGVAFCLLLYTLSCGGGATGGGGGGTGGTPPGTYTITVTGTPASVSDPKGQFAQLQVN